MSFGEFLRLYGQAAQTAGGFFWKAGWAFVLGYFVSAMIQAFVPKGRLTPYLGGQGARSVGLASLFGAISSSCSFAALATARALLVKGASFVATVAFMFASTNLVIELGILIWIFLGWQYLAAELVGGVLLIIVSRELIRRTAPASWLEEAKRKAEEQGEGEREDFSPWRRMTSAAGWRLVGHRFVGEWRMVWEEVLIGFTVAGFMSAMVPERFWALIFLTQRAQESPLNPLYVLENALLAPVVAAATFIGSMGNIPLATVLANGGVLFVGIMGFIYSDLMVPPLVAVNAKYYGWRAALYVAAVMYVSIVCTAIVLHYAFSLLGLAPQSQREIHDVARFAVDYTLWLNLAAVALAAGLAWLHRAHVRAQGGMDMAGGVGPKRVLALTAAGILALGWLVRLAFWLLD